MSLLACPPDVLSRLFTHLDGYTLMRCRMICRYFAESISSDIYAQYSLELYKSGMADLYDTAGTNAIPTVDRLNRLRQYLSIRSSWGKTGPTTTVKLPNMDPFPSQFEYSHGIYLALPHGMAQVVDFWGLLDPSSTERKETGFDLTLHETRGNYTEHCIDKYQDLLAVATIRRGVESESAWLHFLSLSTGEPHPDATLPYIKLPYHVGTFFSLHIDLYGSRVLVCDSIDGSYWGWDIYVYDWRTGEMITHMQTIPDHGFTFFSEDYLIGCLHVPNQNALELRLYPLKTADSDESEPVLILQIPPFKHTMDFDSEINSFPGNVKTSIPPPNRDHSNRHPFHSSPDNAIMALHLDHEKGWSFICVFQRSAILDLINTDSSSTSPRTMEWGTWPQSFLVLPYNISFATYGFRLAVGIPKENTVDVFDFHPRWWKRRFKGVSSGKVFNVRKVKTIPMPKPQRLKVQMGVGDWKAHIDDNLLVLGWVPEHESNGTYHIFKS